MALLTPDEFNNYAQRIASLESGCLALDFETTGFSAYRGDTAFLLGCAHQDLGKFSVYLDRAEIGSSLRALCSNKKLKYAAHNAKFEMSFLKQQFDVTIAGSIWDTEVMERVYYNNYWKKGSYSLQECAKRRGWSKWEPMLAWLEANDHQYHCAPKELIIPYVEQDAWLSLALYCDQVAKFRQWDTATPVPVRPVVALEMETTRELFAMEDFGIRVDIEYCRKALLYERHRAEEAARKFRTLTGDEFIDSRKCLAPIFTRLGISYARTEKGNDSFSSAALIESREHPVVQSVFAYRDATKRASTYWENFLTLATSKERVHPRIQQTGAATSRMSVRDPACQTWPDDSEPDKDTGWINPFPVRRAFLPEPGCLIVSMDWAQMELRKMVDEAGEMTMVRAFKLGHDFHQEVANLANVPRSIAKNGRFAKLYGAGAKKIAQTLGIDLATAKRICRIIDETSPETARYVDELIRHAKQTGMSYNWLGRRYFFDPGFEYKAPNYRIQGGCGEILRIAIKDIAAFLRRYASAPLTRILLPIHDELVFNWHEDDLGLVPDVKKLMIKAHRDAKHLEMDASVTLGINFHDLGDWHEVTV